MTTQPTFPEDPTRPVDTAAPLDAAAQTDASVPLDPPGAPATVAEASDPYFLAAANPVAVPSAHAPRIRWAGIVWGAFLAFLAGTGLWTLAEASRRAAVHDWFLTLAPGSVNPGFIVGFSILAIGLLLLITGGVALLRRAQLRITIER